VTRRFGARGIALTGALALLAPVAAHGGSLGVVYVEANTGGASGGHAAVRFGDTAYHFQRHADASFRLVRDPWPRFHEIYGELQNRTLVVAEFDVSDAAAARIRERFDLRWAEQERDLAERMRARGGVAWLEAARAASGATPPLPGAGLLATTPGDPAAGVRLRAAVLARAGAGALEAARDATERRLASVAAARGALDLESLRESLLAREALAALDEGRGVDPAALIEAGGAGAPPLGDAERATLAAWSAALEQSIAELLASSRPDAGLPLAVAIARWGAAQRSLVSGRLLVLDPFPDDAPRLELDADMGEAALRTLAARGAVTQAEARATQLSRGALDEPRAAWLEESAARAADLAAAVRTRFVREPAPGMTPSRGRSVALPILGERDLAVALAAARDARDAAERRVAERYAYGLVTRNCITELVRTWNAAFPDEAAARAAMGGFLHPGERLGFIPFVFFEQVTSRLRVARVETIASQRERALAKLRAEGAGSPAVALREATTLTSSVYEPRLRDGAFLFFTDDSLWSRPLFGAVNLVYGLGGAALGALAAPFDGGARAAAGAEGALFSLPELVFVNLRKGSFELAEETVR
jgi:hypothetical protein